MKYWLKRIPMMVVTDLRNNCISTELKIHIKNMLWFREKCKMCHSLKIQIRLFTNQRNRKKQKFAWKYWISKTAKIPLKVWKNVVGCQVSTGMQPGPVAAPIKVRFAPCIVSSLKVLIIIFSIHDFQVTDDSICNGNRIWIVRTEICGMCCEKNIWRNPV